MNKDVVAVRPLEALACTSGVELGDGLKTVRLSPAGNVKRKGGDFVMDAEAGRTICDDFDRHNTPIVIDFEHQTLGGEYAAPSGRAPAAGWIEKVWYETGKGLFGLVKWNSDARDAIRKNEYLFVSPVFMVRRDTKRAVRLHSVGLTNVPAIAGMDRLAASNKVSETELWIMSDTKEKEDAKNRTPQELLGKLAQALEISVTGPDIMERALDILEAALAKIEGRVTEETTPEASSVRVALGLSEQAETAAVVLAINGLKQTSETAASLKDQQRDAFLQPYIEKGIVNPKSRAEEYATVCRAFDNDPNDAKVILRSFSTLMPPEGRTTAPGDSARVAAIHAARVAFKSDTFACKATSERAYVNSALRDAGKNPLTDAEIEAYAIAAPTD